MNIWRLTVATLETLQITAGQGDDAEIDLSADGTRLVFSTYRANTNLVEITLEPGARGQLTWLTRDLARSETAPRYSPDGTKIAYFTNRSGAEREGIWVMDADGGNPTQLVEDQGSTNVYPRWSPDGQTLIFYNRVGWSGATPPGLRRVALAGGAPEGRPHLKGVLRRISPTGQRSEVLKEISFFKRPADGHWIARFDIHPDGRRIVVEAQESYEADIGIIEMKK